MKSVHLTTKNTLCYKFFPTKDEEEGKAPQNPTLLEIRDIYPPPMAENKDPRRIKKILNRDEITFGTFVLSLNELLEHVLRYWILDMAQVLFVGAKVGVTVIDVTQEQRPKMYRGTSIFMQWLRNENRDCLLACMDLVRERSLRAGDIISLCWDAKGFMMFKYCPQVVQLD